MTTISLAFVDDHPIFLSGMVAVFSSDPSFTVLAQGTTAKDAQDIVREQNPDVIVMDLNMPGRVLETIAEIACSGTSTRILAFTAANTIDTAIAALEAGASGYVVKPFTAATLEEKLGKIFEKLGM
jgi:DNA-binding NarL/FixJ family response regulator